MGREMIIEKLDKFLHEKPQFVHESDVLYLLIEIRKVIEHQGNNDGTKLLKFYSDWAMHIKKNIITPEIKLIVNEMYQDILKQINTGYPTREMKVNDFTYMEELKNELKMFFEGNGLPTEIIEEKNWIEFIKLLVGVLSNQPIINPIPEVVSINFIPTSPGFVICRVDFKNPINGYTYYEYKNVY